MARRHIACVLTSLTLIPATSWAQTATVWQPEPDKPVQIFAAALSVDDATRVATFSGNVRLTQGGVRLQCSLPRAYYLPGARGDQPKLTRVECEP
jgi:lipopolysaccharide export system protein LptA